MKNVEKHELTAKYIEQRQMPRSHEFGELFSKDAMLVVYDVAGLSPISGTARNRDAILSMFHLMNETFVFRPQASVRISVRSPLDLSWKADKIAPDGSVKFSVTWSERLFLERGKIVCVVAQLSHAAPQLPAVRQGGFMHPDFH